MPQLGTAGDPYISNRYQVISGGGLDHSYGSPSGVRVSCGSASDLSQSDLYNPEAPIEQDSRLEAKKALDVPEQIYVEV